MIDGPILRRTERHHLNGTREIIEEVSIGGMLSEPLSAVKWSEHFGASRNRIVKLLRALGATSVGEGNATRWRLRLSDVPLSYLRGRTPSLHTFVRQAAYSPAGIPENGMHDDVANH